MDLMSDFDKSSWSNKGIPPTGYKELSGKGYAAYNIFRRIDDNKNTDCYSYYLTTDAGIPCTAVLYGAQRDPLKSIGHAYMKMKVIKETSLIVGLIVEEDYVEMNDTFLSSIKVPDPPKKDTQEIDMSMASDLDKDKWEKKSPVPKIKSDIGYIYYNIVRETPEHEGNGLRYYLSTTDEGLLDAMLYDAKRDPLKSIGNCYLKINKKTSPKTIEGIIIEDDWVERK